MFLDRVCDTTTVNCDPMRCENRTLKQQRRPFQHGNVESTAAESPNTEVDASETTSVLDAEMERTPQHRREVRRSACRWRKAWWTCPRSILRRLIGVVTKTPPFGAENRLTEVLEAPALEDLIQRNHTDLPRELTVGHQCCASR